MNDEMRDPADLPEKPDTKLVYFIQGVNGGPVKIGVAFNPEKRLRTLQTGYPFELRLIQAVAGGYRLEQRLHYLLAKDRLRGEWFNPSEMLQALVHNEGYLKRLADESSHVQLPPEGIQNARCAVCGVSLEGLRGRSDYHYAEDGEQCEACIEAASYRESEAT